MTNTCSICTRTLPDTAYVCRPCTNPTLYALQAVIAADGEIETTVAKLDRISEVGGGSAEPEQDEERQPNALYPTPLIVDLDAQAAWAKALDDLGQVALGIAAIRGGGWAWTAAGIGNYLTKQLDYIRHWSTAVATLASIRVACNRLTAIVDRPADRWYAGPCAAQTGETTPDDGAEPEPIYCPAELYPISGQDTITCPTCKAEHDADDRKAWLLEEAEEVWGNATWVAATLSTLGVHCTSSMVRGYANRGRLAPHTDRDPMGYPRYRLGSVRELLASDARAKVERTIMAAIRLANRSAKGGNN